MHRHKKHLGFTLMELMVVAAIIVILTMIGFYTFDTARKTSRDNQRKSDLKTLSVALETYYSRYGRYPDDGASTDCDSSRGTAGTCPGAGSVWSGNLNTALVTNEKILSKLPVDPINDTTYFYLYEPDKNGDGQPVCTTTGNNACRYVLQAYMEKGTLSGGGTGPCIYSIVGGYGQPGFNTKFISLPTSCVGDLTPAGWGTACCAQ